MSQSKPNLRDLFSGVSAEHPVMEYSVLSVGVKDNTFTIKLSGETPDSSFDAVKGAICKAYALDKIAFERECEEKRKKLRKRKIPLYLHR